jgi:hypothetical protein
MVKSMAARRKEELIDSGVRTARPCMRCLDAMSRGELVKDTVGCVVSTDEDLWEDWSGEETFALRCQHCLGLGQDCFGVGLLARIVPVWR